MKTQGFNKNKNLNPKPVYFLAITMTSNKISGLAIGASTQALTGLFSGSIHDTHISFMAGELGGSESESCIFTYMSYEHKSYQALKLVVDFRGFIQILSSQLLNQQTHSHL